MLTKQPEFRRLQSWTRKVLGVKICMMSSWAPSGVIINRPGITPFVIYGFILLSIFFGSLGFWIQGRRKPIFFSLKNTKWMFANPKTNTILWTAIASIVAWLTVWVYACTISLMARKLIVKGAKISTIESWVKLSNQGTMFDKRRPWLSLYTVLSALVTAALTVGFAGLLTPVSLIKTNPLSGTELDMTKSTFWDWYLDTTNRTVVGCTWWPYTNNQTGESYMFSTCPYRDDTSMALQAGRAAVEQGLGLKSITKIGDVNFNGTTGGTLPVGRNGFRAFDDIDYFLDEKPFPPTYNYSMLLQGSTVDVTCEQNDTSPISQVIINTIPTKITSGPEIGPNSIRNYTHTRYDFNHTYSYGR
ncbi:hypothetical protein P167DRAFT_203715 [Morchella conica CCBAS932]|uniref:Uncharacterized protein n=1 Tax=Morchella conica CCBAS932 TaxID=1392247 RepID=A0A3N4L2H5_9PEZI|nr:hypothetical protein P167DRAFT_203715 [Morchella conica CCBAS932]